MKEPALFKKFPGFEHIPELLLRCTDYTSDESSRYRLDIPWIADGFVYATDGRIAARMPSNELPKTLIKRLSDLKDRRVPGVAKVFGGTFIKIPAKLPELANPLCLCPKCHHVHADERSMTEFIEVGTVSLAYSYIVMLRRYGVEQVWTPKRTKEPQPVKFIAGNVEGRLMPGSSR